MGAGAAAWVLTSRTGDGITQRDDPYLVTDGSTVYSAISTDEGQIEVVQAIGDGDLVMPYDALEAQAARWASFAWGNHKDVVVIANDAGYTVADVDPGTGAAEILYRGGPTYSVDVVTNHDANVALLSIVNAIEPEEQYSCVVLGPDEQVIEVDGGCSFATASGLLATAGSGDEIIFHKVGEDGLTEMGRVSGSVMSLGAAGDLVPVASSAGAGVSVGWYNAATGEQGGSTPIPAAINWDTVHFSADGSSMIYSTGETGVGPEAFTGLTQVVSDGSQRQLSSDPEVFAAIAQDGTTVWWSEHAGDRYVIKRQSIDETVPTELGSFPDSETGRIEVDDAGLAGTGAPLIYRFTEGDDLSEVEGHAWVYTATEDTLTEVSNLAANNIKSFDMVTAGASDSIYLSASTYGADRWTVARLDTAAGGAKIFLSEFGYDFVGITEILDGEGACLLVYTAEVPSVCQTEGGQNVTLAAFQDGLILLSGEDAIYYSTSIGTVATHRIPVGDLAQDSVILDGYALVSGPGLKPPVMVDWAGS